MDIAGDIGQFYGDQMDCPCGKEVCFLRRSPSQQLELQRTILLVHPSDLEPSAEITKTYFSKVPQGPKLYELPTGS